MTSQIAVASDTLIASLKDGWPSTDLNKIFPKGDVVQTSALRGTIMYSILRAHSRRIYARLFERNKCVVRTANVCKSLILLSNGKLLDLLNTRDQRHFITKYDTAANFDVARMSRQEVTKLPPYCYAIYPSEIQNCVSSGIAPSETNGDDLRSLLNVYFEYNFDPPCSEILMNVVAKTDSKTLNTLWFNDGAIRSFIQMMNPPAELKFKLAIFTSTVEADHDIDAFLEKISTGNVNTALLTNDAPEVAEEKSNSSGKDGNSRSKRSYARSAQPPSTTTPESSSRRRARPSAAVGGEPSNDDSSDDEKKNPKPDPSAKGDPDPSSTASEDKDSEEPSREVLPVGNHRAQSRARKRKAKRNLRRKRRARNPISAALPLPVNGWDLKRARLF